ncbi:MAG: 4Fe-4S dicluster domain-containing protein [Planctomycetota bacterium]
MPSDPRFADEIMARSGQNIRLCYQCLKCFAGCTMAEYMEKKPNGILRLIQYGERAKVLSHKDIWYCVTCKKCGTHCPNDIDMSAVFDALRELALESGTAYASERNIPVIHEEFVRTIKMFGRLHEPLFFVMYMVRSLDLFSSLNSGLLLFLRRKLPLTPGRIREIDDFRAMFEKAYRPRVADEKTEGTP